MAMFFFCKSINIVDLDSYYCIGKKRYECKWTWETIKNCTYI